MAICDYCKEELTCEDELVSLDCNGNEAPLVEFGGSGDFYGILCTTCYEQGKAQELEIFKKQKEIFKK